MAEPHGSHRLQEHVASASGPDIPSEHPHGHSHSHGHAGPDDARFIEMLDLDGEVLAEHMITVTGWIADRRGPRPVHRILDLGAGTGSGTFALLRRFDQARATTLDTSARMVEHLGERAAHTGLAQRIVALQCDLDTDPLPPGPFDLAWASASMHHLADPNAVLERLCSVLAPDGILVLVEFESFPRFLPDDLGLGDPGLEERCHARADRIRTERHPTIDADWGARLREHGYSVAAERTFPIDLPAPLSAAALRYARLTLTGMREMLGEELTDEDRAVLDALLDPEGPHRLENRPDLRVRFARRAWIGRPTEG